jgi:hypothetical protein
VIVRGTGGKFATILSTDGGQRNGQVSGLFHWDILPMPTCASWVIFGAASCFGKGSFA